MNSSTLPQWMILMLDLMGMKSRLGSQLFVSINLQYSEAISWSFNVPLSQLVQSNYCMILSQKKKWKQASYLYIQYILVLLSQKEQLTYFSTWIMNRQKSTRECQFLRSQISENSLQHLLISSLTLKIDVSLGSKKYKRTNLKVMMNGLSFLNQWLRLWRPNSSKP